MDKMMSAAEKLTENSMETCDKDTGNFEENFNRLAEKLESYLLTADEIKTQSPILYQRIQDAIDEMDAAWLIKDLTAFSEAIKIIEQLYLKAMREILER
jgi:hypothetical protein